VAQARLTLSYTHVVAAIAGRIANKTASPGNIVAAGTPLMAVVPRDVYVTANLKETQLNHIVRGQPVAIKVDAYPDLKLTGKVDSVEPASGQTFSVIPPQNATGNWVKIVQRVPVKIVFDQIPDDPNRRLAPGMSVEISAKVR
jgi:membrane fusion protein (multidrug efflux system)